MFYVINNNIMSESGLNTPILIYKGFLYAEYEFI